MRRTPRASPLPSLLVALLLVVVVTLVMIFVLLVGNHDNDNSFSSVHSRRGHTRLGTRILRRQSRQHHRRHALEKYTPDKTNSTSCTLYYINGTTTVYTWDTQLQYFVEQKASRTSWLSASGNLPPPCREADDSEDGTGQEDVQEFFFGEGNESSAVAAAEGAAEPSNIVRVAVSIALPPYHDGDPGGGRERRRFMEADAVGRQLWQQFQQEMQPPTTATTTMPSSSDHLPSQQQQQPQRRRRRRISHLESVKGGIPVRVAEAVTSLFNRTARSAVYLFNHPDLTAAANATSHSYISNNQSADEFASDYHSSYSEQSPPQAHVLPLLDSDDDPEEERAIFEHALQSAADLMVTLVSITDVLPNQTMYFFLKPSKSFQRERRSPQFIWEFFHDNTLAERVELPGDDHYDVDSEHVDGIDTTNIATMASENTTTIAPENIASTTTSMASDNRTSTTTNVTSNTITTPTMESSSEVDDPDDRRRQLEVEFQNYDPERAYDAGVLSPHPESSSDEGGETAASVLESEQRIADAPPAHGESGGSKSRSPEPAIWWKHTLEYRCYQRNELGSLQPLTQRDALERIERQFVKWMRFHVETTSGVQYSLHHGHVQGVAMPGEEYPIMVDPSDDFYDLDGLYLDDDLYNDAGSNHHHEGMDGSSFPEPLSTRIGPERTREWVGLGMLLATVVSSGLLTAMSHSRMLRRKEQDMWGAIGTEQALEGMLNVGWRINHINIEVEDNSRAEGGVTMSGRPLPPQRLRQQPVLEIFEKGRAGYLEDDSILLGDFMFATE